MTSHAELHAVRSQLRDVYTSIKAYQNPISRPPIIDACLEDRVDDVQHAESIQGLRGLREIVRKDLEVLDKFLDNSQSSGAPPLSTNAPYLVAVWKEVLAARAQPVVAVGKMFEIERPGTARSRVKHPASAVKVDVVAGGGKEWIRVNTMKNSRMLAELREIDSYDTDSEDDAGVDRPSLAQVEFDNSLLRAGRSLVEAASANLMPGSKKAPHITIRLTRLDPNPVHERDRDPRIQRTIRVLEDMHITVVLGELTDVSFPSLRGPSPTPQTFLPTMHINLDLSMLVALVSDLTHSGVAVSLEEASARYTPPPSYREWKQERIRLGKAKASSEAASEQGLASHSRSLAAQAMQEARRGLFAELHDRLADAGVLDSAEFWTTQEAVARCTRIVMKIGGPHEIARAAALFAPAHETASAAAEFWAGSRWPLNFVPIIPLRILAPIPSVESLANKDVDAKPTFFHLLQSTCEALLASDPIMVLRRPISDVHQPSLAAKNDVADEDSQSDSEIQRAPVLSSNLKLTAHTVESMLHGAVRGWTTATANKSSVRAMLREARAHSVGAGSTGLLTGAASTKEQEDFRAALWIVEPRSLAEGMRSD